MKINYRTWLLVVLVFIFLGLNWHLLFNYELIWWDSAVYTGMGKYIWSEGNSGFWEAARPPLLPVLLGFLWKLGLDPVFFGRILALFFSTGVLVLIYLLGKEISSPNVGILAALLTAFSTTYLFFSTHIMTGIPSLFFFLLGLILIWRNALFFAGIFFGISFLTRFFALLPIILLVILIVHYHKKNSTFWPYFFQIGGGFSLVLFPFLFFNLFMYQDALLPFTLQFYLSNETGLPFNEPFFYYFVNLFKENPLLLLIALAPLHMKNQKTKIIFWLVIFTLTLYSLSSHKEMRIILILYPFIFLLLAHTLSEIMKSSKNIKLLFCLLILPWILFSFLNFSSFQPTSSENHPLELFLNLASQNDVTWISDPRFAVDKDSLFGLLYYPYQQLPAPTYLIMDTCNLKGNSFDYTKKTIQQIERFTKNMDTLYSDTIGGCTQVVLRTSQTSLS